MSNISFLSSEYCWDDGWILCRFAFIMEECFEVCFKIVSAASEMPLGNCFIVFYVLFVKETKYLMEPISWLVFHSRLTPPQCRGCHSTHGSLNPLRMNFHLKTVSCHYSRVYLVGVGEFKGGYKAKGNSPLRVLWQANLMRNFHLSYKMHSALL